MSPVTNNDAWVFPSEKLTTPMSKDNCWNRNIKRALAKAGLAWANFLVMWRTHASLMGDLGIKEKLVADRWGHSVDVDQNVYRQSPVARRVRAVNRLERRR